jgi:hypothetical protein
MQLLRRATCLEIANIHFFYVSSRNPVEKKYEYYQHTIQYLPQHPHAGARFPNGTGIGGLLIDPLAKKALREKRCKADNAIDSISFEVLKRIRTVVNKS